MILRKEMKDSLTKQGMQNMRSTGRMTGCKAVPAERGKHSFFFKTVPLIFLTVKKKTHLI